MGETFIHFLSRLSSSEVGLVIFIFIAPVIIGELLFFKMIISPALDIFKVSVFELQNRILRLLLNLDQSLQNINERLDAIQRQISQLKDNSSDET